MAGEDGDPFAECWACTLLFLPWVQTLLQGVGSRDWSSVPCVHRLPRVNCPCGLYKHLSLQ